MIRMLIAVAAIFAITAESYSQEGDPKVGDRLVIQMSGDLAKHYTRLLQAKVPTAGLTVETGATIVELVGQGKVRIEHSSQIRQDPNQRHLLTLTGTVDSSKITSHVLPKGTAIYSSPSAKQPKLVDAETKTLRLELSELRDLKICKWTLAEEIGE